MANLAKEIAEAAKMPNCKGTKTNCVDGLAIAEAKETNKKTSVNQIIEACLNLPTIETDATFGALYQSATNDIAKNGLKAAWMQLPNVAAAYNMGYNDIVSACSGTLNLEGAAALVQEYASANKCEAVVFKMPSNDTKADALTCVTVNVSGVPVSLNMVVETFEASKVDYKKRVAALASAYRLIKKCSGGIKSTAELLATAEKAVLDLKARGVALDEVLATITKLYEA